MTDRFKRALSRSSSGSTSHGVVVGIGTTVLAVPAAQIQEIICLGDLDASPQLPKRFTGPTRVLGKLLSLVNLNGCFPRAEDSFVVTGRTCILVLKARSAAGPRIHKSVVVDRVERLLEFDQTDLEPGNQKRKDVLSTSTLGVLKRQPQLLLIDLQRLIKSSSGSKG